MDEHVVEWDKQISRDGTHTNRYMQDMIRSVMEDRRRRDDPKYVYSPPEGFETLTTGEWAITPDTEWGRKAIKEIEARDALRAHYKNVQAQNKVDRVWFYVGVVGLLALGAWGAADKKAAQAGAPPEAKSQLMHCASLSTPRDQTDCLDQAGISLDEQDYPKNEGRRK